MSVTVLAAAINHARALSDTLRVLTNEAHATHVLRTSPSGMDDFLMSLNSDLDTLYYLVAGVRGTD
jgi:hypothetical protein